MGLGLEARAIGNGARGRFDMDGNMKDGDMEKEVGGQEMTAWFHCSKASRILPVRARPAVITNSGARV